MWDWELYEEVVKDPAEDETEVNGGGANYVRVNDGEMNDVGGEWWWN